MKKLSVKIIALIVIFVFALSFSACSDVDRIDNAQPPTQTESPDGDSQTNPSEEDPSDNPGGSQTKPSEDDPSENPNDNQQDQPEINYTYNVNIGEVDYDYGDDLSATEVLDRIRPTVVDIRSFLSTGVSSGSGVIMGLADTADAEQYFIITNHHVIDGGKSFAVKILTIADDGSEAHTEYDASLIGSAPSRDIAVLAVRLPKGTGLTTAHFIDDSDKVKVGTSVYAIGNPLGLLGGTVTHGIISAAKREIYVGDIGTMTLMQTDATVNGGNSGGGLFDTKGNLIGIINSQYESYNYQSVEGLNFAIPGNDAKFAMKALIDTHEEDENGAVTRYGYIEGDTRQEVTFSSAMIYDDKTLKSANTYLIAGAASQSSPVYEAWGTKTMAVTAITVNGIKTEFNGITEDSAGLADALLTEVKVGDEIVIDYKEIVSISNGPFFTYNYLAGETLSLNITATQYIYQP